MTSYRPGVDGDSDACFELMVEAVDDLVRRLGGPADSMSGDPSTAELEATYQHLAATGDQWWIAEDEADGRVVGYARSILRDGVRELTEFFVRPDVQGGGIGRELLGRAFSAAGARHRAIVATVDARAIARYLRESLDVRALIVGFSGTPRSEPLETDLVRSPIDPAAPPLDEIAAIDRATLGFRRDEDHRWLAGQRTGWLYRRDGVAAGYGYHPPRESWGGPYAVIDPPDLPVLLADGEAAAAEAGHGSTTFDLPLLARTAVDHLLERGYRIDPFLALYFSDGPDERLERYVLTTPPFFA
jgi:GNAT superfamily N-acetyltransferase